MICIGEQWYQDMRDFMLQYFMHILGSEVRVEDTSAELI